MSKFKPGDERINRAGRPKGAKNRNLLRDKVESIINANINQIQGWLDDMEPRDRANFLLRLLEYSLPKLRSTEFTSELETLSEEDLDRIINRLMTDNYEQN